MIRWMRNSLVALALCLSATAAVYGQSASPSPRESQPMDFAVMFNAEHAQYSYGSGFWMFGGSAEVAIKLKYNFSLAINSTGTASSGVNGGVPFSKVMTTAGPRYTLPLGHSSAGRSRIFVEGLFGGVHGFNSTFPATAGPLTSANSVAMQLGGGYEWSLKRAWAIRVLDVHYVRTDLPNGSTNRQNDLLLGAGIVWRPVDHTAK